MPDVFSRQKRSEVMSRIRGTGNDATELALIRVMRANGIRGWRRNFPLFGRPDFAFPRLKLAVFVDGCFWHGCAKHGNMPRSNRQFWEKKMASNHARDLRVSSELRSRGWKVVRIWEHELRRKEIRKLVRRLERIIAGG